MSPPGKVATETSVELAVNIKAGTLLSLRLSGKDCSMCMSLSSDEAERCRSCSGTRKVKFTQQEVENACKLSKAMLTAYEHGRCAAPLSDAMRLAEYFKVPLAELITEESMIGLANTHSTAEVLGIGSDAPGE